MTAEASPKVRVGIPYRTRKEELKNERESYEKYLRAARAVGAEPVEISLGLTSTELTQVVRGLDAFILPGSPADVHPSLFKAAVHPNCSIADPCRESTDFAVLAHAFKQQKPVLAICYGTQGLNVFLGGSLVVPRFVIQGTEMTILDTFSRSLQAMGGQLCRSSEISSIGVPALRPM